MVLQTQHQLIYSMKGETLVQTMQAFYNWLFQEAGSNDSLRDNLVRLTKVGPGQLADMEYEPGWEPWEASETELIELKT